MTDTGSNPTPAMLQRLSSLRELAADELKALSKELYLHEGRRGDVLLELGATDDCTLYLIEGETRLIAEDGGVKIIRHTDISAQAPLARLRPSHYKVVAESFVRYLRIDNRLFEQTAGKLEQGSSLTLETYQVEEEDDLGYLDVENQLTVKIYEDLNASRLLLPSLPDVAVRIGEAVIEDTTDARKIGALIETDPAIALKMVKAANSARFGGVSKVATVTEAVARLGLQNTRMLVVAFALAFRGGAIPLAELWGHIDIALNLLAGSLVGAWWAAGHAMRLVSLHPGVTLEQVRENTGFELEVPRQVPVTAAPTAGQLAIIAALDPHNQRAYQIKDNPPGVRGGAGIPRASAE